MAWGERRYRWGRVGMDNGYSKMFVLCKQKKHAQNMAKEARELGGVT